METAAEAFCLRKRGLAMGVSARAAVGFHKVGSTGSSDPTLVRIEVPTDWTEDQAIMKKSIWNPHLNINLLLGAFTTDVLSNLCALETR